MVGPMFCILRGFLATPANLFLGWCFCPSFVTWWIPFSVLLMVDIQTTGYSFSDLLPPNDLQFSEITSRSFRTSWTPPAARVMSYLVRYRKAEDITGDYISIALPGDATSVVLQHLFPLTAYEVNVFAQYDKGDSFPLSGEETTLEGTVACAWNSNGTLRTPNKNNYKPMCSLLCRTRTRSKPTCFRGDYKQFQSVMARCSRSGHQIPPVLCSTEWYWGNTGGSNYWNRDFHRSPGAFPHHDLPSVCVCWVFNRLGSGDADRRHHQGRWARKSNPEWLLETKTSESQLSCHSFFFIFSLRFSSWPSRVWWDHFHNETGLAAC